MPAFYIILLGLFIFLSVGILLFVFAGKLAIWMNTLNLTIWKKLGYNAGDTWWIKEGSPSNLKKGILLTRIFSLVWALMVLALLIVIIIASITGNLHV